MPLHFVPEGEYSEFIGVWDKLYPKEVCEQLTEWFDETWAYCATNVEREGCGPGWEVGSTQNPDGALGRDDRSLYLNEINPGLCLTFYPVLQACFRDYTQKYSQLKQVPMVSEAVKLKKQDPGGGFHMWHYENGNATTATRELAWMVYLNDMPEGEGETEFLYQKKRFSPTMGTVLIWPAAMTHVHRGLLVRTKSKYIATGWFNKIAVD